MVSLHEISFLISTISAGVWKAVYSILELSYHIGHVLVSQILIITNYFIQCIQLVTAGIQIMTEDYMVFAVDVREWMHLLLQGCENVGLWSYEGVIKILWSFNHGGLKVVSGIGLVGDNIQQLVHNSIFFIVAIAEAIKEGFVLLGSSIWLCVTLIPLTILFCIETIFNVLTDICNQSNFYLYKLYQNVQLTICTIIKFFWDIPINSLYGFIIGLFLLYLICKNFRVVCSFMVNVICCIYMCVISFGNHLWTGSFLQNNEHHINKLHAPQLAQEFAARPQAALFDDMLCVVCHDKERSIIVLPCKHMCLCQDCCHELLRVQKMCPICRTAVRRTMKVYV